MTGSMSAASASAARGTVTPLILRVAEATSSPFATWTKTTLNRKAQQFPDAKHYRDFRKMLEEMDKSIDAVTVSIPDHCHAVATAMAMHMGKHVYCQKPLTQTVYEARFIRNLAKEKKVATQMGNQGSAGQRIAPGR